MTDGATPDDLTALLTTLVEEKAGLQQFMESILDNVIHKLKAEHGYVLLDDHGDFSAVFARAVDGKPMSRDNLELSKSIARQVLESGEPLVIEDASTGREFQVTESIALFRPLSVMCVPLSYRDVMVGVIYVDSKDVRHLFDDSMLPELQNLAASVSRHLTINMTIREALTTTSRLIASLEARPKTRPPTRPVSGKPPT